MLLVKRGRALLFASLLILPLLLVQSEATALIKPAPLKRGDRLALMTLSSPAKGTRLEESVKAVKELFGYEPVLYPSSRIARGYLTGSSDEAKARELEEAFADPEIKGIICVMGGYGSQRILKHLNAQVIKNNPKVFMGFSDVTALHSFINDKCGVATFHGPMAFTISRAVRKSHDLRWLDWSRRLIERPSLLPGLIENSEPLVAYRGGKATGEIAGGNLTILASLTGTPWQTDFDGKIVFLEEIGEDTYRVERLLIQLRDSGAFDKATGFLLGSFEDCNPQEGDQTLDEIIKDVLVPLGKPVLANMKAGHGAVNYAIPFGVRAEIDGDRKTIRFLEKALNN